MEWLQLNLLSPLVEEHFIDQQAGFGKSTTGQVLNLTQYIEDGFQRKQITGAIFVDLTAAYGTVSYRHLLTKILQMTKDPLLNKFLGVMIRNRRFFVVLNNKKSRVRLQRNGLPQRSVLGLFLCNIYANDQPQDLQIKQFIYADDLCITCRDTVFDHVEKTLSNAVN